MELPCPAGVQSHSADMPSEMPLAIVIDDRVQVLVMHKLRKAVWLDFWDMGPSLLYLHKKVS